MIPRIALPVIVIALFAVSLPAADWPQWGGADARNMVSAERHLPDRFEPGEKDPKTSVIDMATTRNVRWLARLGTQTYGNVTVSQGRVLIGTNDASLDDPRFQTTRGGLVLCLDAMTGKPLWKLVVPRLGRKIKDFNFDDLDLGVCSSPTVEGNRVYLVTSRCDVLCLDLDGQANGNEGPFVNEGAYQAAQGKPPAPLRHDDGDIVWQYNMLDELPVWPQDAANCSILIHGDLLYVCTSNGVDKTHDRVPLPLAPSLIVLDKRTGKVVATDNEKIGTRLFHGQWSSPSLGVVRGKPLVFFGGGDGLCYAFEALDQVPTQPVHLKKVWSFDCNPPHYKVVDGKPVNYRDGDVRRKHGNTGDGSFVGPSEIIATPAFHDNRVYVVTGQDPAHGRGKGILSAIDATQTGDITTSGKLWTCEQIQRSLSTVSVDRGLLYVADVAGGLHCLDAKTGQLLWQHDMKSQVWGSTLVADGKVYVGTQKAFWVFAAGRTKQLLAEIHLGSPCYCTAVAANGVLYVNSHKYLWACALPSGPETAGGDAPLGGLLGK